MIMIILSCLILWYILIFSPLTGALVLELYNVSDPSQASPHGSNHTVGVDDYVHCTRDPSWILPGFPNFVDYHRECSNAWGKAIQDLNKIGFRHGYDTEFEFLDRGSPAQTTKPQILLPRKFVASECPAFDRIIVLEIANRIYSAR